MNLNNFFFKSELEKTGNDTKIRSQIIKKYLCYQSLVIMNFRQNLSYHILRFFLEILIFMFFKRFSYNYILNFLRKNTMKMYK